MEEELVEAARVGDVGTFNRIMEQDPDTLERACSGHVDSPLHLAARRGTAEIVKQIVTRLPSLATETNQQGMTPLHLASLKGYVETVRELLKAKLDEGKVNQCLLKDEEGWTPLHCASQKGKISVIEELIRACPQCLKHVTEKRDTVLHVAVKANQFEAVKVLEDSIKRHNLDYLLKAKDQRGKSADQIEAAKKSQSLQVWQVVEVLKEDDEMREERHINIEEEGNEESEASNKKDQETMSSGERQAQQNAILVVATLIITLTYQGLANPPTTLLIDGSTKLDWGCAFREARSHNWRNQLKDCPAALAVLFLLFNTMIFFQSILIVVMALRGKTVLRAAQWLTMFLILCYNMLLTAVNYYMIYFSIACSVLLGAALGYLHRPKKPLDWKWVTLARWALVCRG